MGYMGVSIENEKRKFVLKGPQVGENTSNAFDDAFCISFA